MEVTRPLGIAAATTCADTWNVLIQNGADPEIQTEEDGGNAFHVLVKMASIYNGDTDVYVKWYSRIIQTLDINTRKNVLHHEDNYGMKPLELASHLNTLDLFLAIFCTPDVYLFKLSNGLQLEHLFDVSEYETVDTPNRRSVSPMICLQQLDLKEISKNRTQCCFRFKAVETWLDLKSGVNRYLVAFWCLFRCFIFISVLVASLSTNDRDYCTLKDHIKNSTQTAFSNETCSSTTQYCPGTYIYLNNTQFYPLLGALLISCLLGVLVDLYDIVTYYRRKTLTSLNRESSMMKIQQFSRFATFTFQLFVGVAIVSVQLTKVDISGYETLVNITLTIGLCLGVWSLLYFVQLLPVTGHYVIVIQLMLADLGNFSILYFLLVIPFIQGFYRIGNEGTCTEEFSGIWSTLYSSFMIMLNMMNLRGLEVPDAVALYCIHYGYVIIIAIMLINFMVATMSNTATQVFDNSQVIKWVQRLSVINPIERRCHRVLSWYYKWMQKRHFLVRDGRIYVRVEAMIGPHLEKEIY